MSDGLEELRDRRRYLKDWLAGFKSAGEIAPQVQMELERTEWQIGALSSLPIEANEIPFNGHGRLLQRENAHLYGSLPMIPKYDPNLVSSSSAITSSGTASVFGHIAAVGDLGTPGALAYSEKYRKEYFKLQESQERPQSVRRLLAQHVYPETVARFDSASNAYSSVKSGIGQRSVAAFEMRTFLDGVKGNLFNKARNWPGENMKWLTMAERLAKNGPTGMEYQELLAQEKVNSSLVERLSQVAKHREGQSYTDLDVIWTQLLDHIYIVLGLVKLKA